MRGQDPSSQGTGLGLGWVWALGAPGMLFTTRILLLGWLAGCAGSSASLCSSLAPKQLASRPFPRLCLPACTPFPAAPEALEQTSFGRRNWEWGLNAEGPSIGLVTSLM